MNWQQFSQLKVESVLLTFFCGYWHYIFNNVISETLMRWDDSFLLKSQKPCKCVQLVILLSDHRAISSLSPLSPWNNIKHWTGDSNIINIHTNEWNEQPKNTVEKQQQITPLRKSCIKWNKTLWPILMVCLKLSLIVLSVCLCVCV